MIIPEQFKYLATCFDPRSDQEHVAVRIGYALRCRTIFSRKTERL